jgi:hypothetical protein
VFAQLRRRWLPRFFAVHFITSIVAPTLAPFQTIGLDEAIRIASSNASVDSSPGRTMPMSTDRSVVPGSMLRIGQRVRNRTKVSITSFADDAAPALYQMAAERRGRNSRLMGQSDPAPVLRI